MSLNGSLHASVPHFNKSETLCNISSDFFLQEFASPLHCPRNQYRILNIQRPLLKFIFSKLSEYLAHRDVLQIRVRATCERCHGPFFFSYSFISITSYCPPHDSWPCQSKRLILAGRSNDAMEFMNVFIWLFYMVLSKLSTPLQYIGLPAERK